MWRPLVAIALLALSMLSATDGVIGILRHNGLETALLLPQTAVVAGPALDRLGVDVGALLAKALASDTADASRPAVLAALRATPAVAVHCATCLEALAAAVVDPRQPARARVEMIEILGNSDSTEIVSQALAHAAKDANVAVRGAALLAQMPRGRGRVGVRREPGRPRPAFGNPREEDTSRRLPGTGIVLKTVRFQDHRKSRRIRPCSPLFSLFRQCSH